MVFRCRVQTLTLRLIAFAVFCLFFAADTPWLAGAGEIQPPALTQSFTALNVSPNPVVVGQTVTFKATIVAAESGGVGKPTGTVTFLQGSNQFGTATLDANGVATITSSSFALGTYPITAMYGGDSNFSPSTSAVVILIVEQMSSQKATTTTLRINPNPAQIGETVTFTAQVTGGTGVLANATGTVTFYQGANQIGTATLDASSMASFSSSNFPTTGTYSMTAVYGGDSNYQPSTSVPVTLTIVPVGQLTPTTTTLSSSNPNANFGDTVMFTANVQGGMGNPPTGTVTFLDGGTTLGTGPLANGLASFSTSSLSIGSHTITAQYGGDNTQFMGSTSAPLTQTIGNSSNQTFIISINPGIVTVSQGESGMSTLTVSPAGGFNQPVTFVCSNLPLFAACSFNPPTVTPDGSNKPVTTALTVTTGTKRALLMWLRLHPQGSLPANVLAVFSVGLLGLVQVRGRVRKGSWRGTKLIAGALFLLCLCTTFWLVACGGSGSNANSVTPKGQTIVTVAGSTTTGAQTTTFTLNVQ